MVTEVSAEVPPATPELPPRFGRYQIVRRLGRGGMGAVYLAEDTQLGRRVALKVPRLGWVDDSAVLERFFREARAAANLHHPNICPVYDVGQIEGIYHLTMAYIEGRPLSKLIDPAHWLEVPQVLDIVQQVASALEAAHQQGVIHRDLKPSNIIVKPDGLPVVMDFGLARVSDQLGSRITHSGVIVGTPAYMSPEQAAGDDAAVGPASDIYSLGVIFYELLTGRVPFEGSVTAVLCQIVMADADPPRQFRPELDPAVEEVCLKAMAKRVHDRYSSMHELAEALAGLRAGAGSVATSTPQRQLTPQDAETVGGPEPPTPLGLSSLSPEQAARRTELLSQASELYRHGALEQALQTLAEADAAFPGDADIRALLSRYRRAIALVQETVRERIPDLERQRKLFAVQRAIESVRETGIPVKGLDEFSERVTKRLHQAASRVAFARRRLAQYHYDEALAAANEALAVAADSPDAQEVAQAAQQALSVLRHDARLITQATAARRWFFAESILVRMRREGLQDAMLSDLVAQVQFGMAQANRYLRLLTWMLAGGFAWIASGWLAGLATAGLEPVLQSAVAAGEPITETLAKTAGPVIQLLLAAFVLSLLQGCWRSVGVARTGRRVFGALLGGLVVAATWLAAAHLMPGSIGGPGLGLPTAADLAWAAVYGAVAGSILAELAARLLDVEGSKPGWMGLFAGALAAVFGALMFVPPESSNPLAALLPAAILFGALAIIFQARPRGAYLAVLAAGVVSAGVQLGFAFAREGWPTLALDFGLLTAAAYGAFPSTRRWRPLGLASSLAAASVVAARLIDVIPAYPPATMLATTWLLATGAITLYCANHLQAVLHVPDRWRLHKLLTAAE